ncbi:MAG: hypothetical protein ACI4SG_03295 [Oligosphaeraceae bacterium]
MPPLLRNILILPWALLLPALLPAREPLPLDTTPLLPEARLLPPSPWRIPLCLLLLLLLLGLLFLVLRAVDKHRRRRSAPPPPPHLQAQAALQALMAQLPSTPEEQEAWMARLADLTREYLAGRFALEARRLTTQETTDALESLPSLTDAQRRFLQNLLQSCDMAKFARVTLPREELRALGRECQSFLLETAPEEPTKEDAP